MGSENRFALVLVKQHEGETHDTKRCQRQKAVTELLPAVPLPDTTTWDQIKGRAHGTKRIGQIMSSCLSLVLVPGLPAC